MPEGELSRHAKSYKTAGALTPYDYAELQSYYQKLDGYKGKPEYVIKWTELFPKIEAIREKQFQDIPEIGMIIGTCLLKMAIDYYELKGYHVKDLEGSEIDTEYNIDLRAIKTDEIVVAQVKSRLSDRDIAKFSNLAPRYFGIDKRYKNKKQKELTFIYYKLDEAAKSALTKFVHESRKNKFITHTLTFDWIAKKIPRYCKVLKQLEEYMALRKKKG